MNEAMRSFYKYMFQYRRFSYKKDKDGSYAFMFVVKDREINRIVLSPNKKPYSMFVFHLGCHSGYGEE